MLSYLRKKMKTIMIIVAVLFAATMFYGLSYTGIKGMSTKPNKDSIATINGKEIDNKRFQQTLNRMFAAEKGRIKPETAMTYQAVALDQTIDFTLMLNSAKRKFRVGGGEIDQALSQIMEANKIPNKSVLENALKSSGQTLSQFKKQLKEEMVVSKMVNSVKGEVTILPDDLREVKASHILIALKGSDQKSDFEARIKAEEVLQKVKDGQSFSALALLYSDDKGSMSNGGSLGYFTTGSMVPEFEKAAFSLKPGTISEVVRSPFGYHIIKVEDTRLRKVKEKGKEINEEVLAEKQEFAVRKWLYGLRQNAKIEINEPLINAHSMLLSGRINEAIASYNQASLSNPYNPYIHLFLGDAYQKTGNAEFAMVEYKKASDNSGADPSLLMAVGDNYVSMKNKALALEEYRRASLIAGDNKDIHKELQTIFTKLGATADASKEKKELSRIEKKEKFEKEIQEKMK